VPRKSKRESLHRTQGDPRFASPSGMAPQAVWLHDRRRRPLSGGRTGSCHRSHRAQWSEHDHDHVADPWPRSPERWGGHRGRAGGRAGFPLLAGPFARGRGAHRCQVNSSKPHSRWVSRPLQCLPPTAGCASLNLGLKRGPANDRDHLGHPHWTGRWQLQQSA
jgi:hypothetical protein